MMPPREDLERAVATLATFTQVARRSDPSEATLHTVCRGVWRYVEAVAAIEQLTREEALLLVSNDYLVRSALSVLLAGYFQPLPQS